MAKKIYDKPIIVQKIDEDTEKWKSIYTLHANVNKTRQGEEYLSAGAIQSKNKLTFEVRYFKKIEDIELNTQLYRILFNFVICVFGKLKSFRPLTISQHMTMF